MRANAAFGASEAYPTIEEKAAAVCCGLIGNHGFIDGNKRIGVMVLLLLLSKNGVDLRYTQGELIRLGLDAAHQRHDPLLERGKEGVELLLAAAGMLHGEAELVAVGYI